METVTFVALLLSAATVIIGSGDATLVPMTKEMKQTLVDTHNELRARTARGQCGSQPSAGDMMLLEWDDRLMEKAAVWAAKCQIGHDSKEDREIPGHSWVGQNWAGGPIANLSLMVRRWHAEYKDYNFMERSCTPGKMCGHYTQVVWAMSRLVGCALAECSMYPATLVCNYADGGNIGGTSPYVVGAPASKCIGEYAFTQGSLCLRKDQCSGGSGGGSVPSDPSVPNVPNVPNVPSVTSAPNVPSVTTYPGGGSVPWDGGDFGGGDGGGWSDWSDTQPRKSLSKMSASTDGTCRCAISCMNGGTLDSANCKCACTADFYGTRCELACSDPVAWRPSCENDTDACKNYPSYCPKTCKRCTTGDITDKQAVNTDGIISRVPPLSK